jgi:hypothetical protein
MNHGANVSQRADHLLFLTRRKVKFEPAVTTLVETVGAKFSSSFERKHFKDSLCGMRPVVPLRSDNRFTYLTPCWPSLSRYWLRWRDPAQEASG